VVNACRRQGIAAAMSCSSAADAAVLVGRGVRCLSWSHDRHLLMRAYSGGVAGLRAATGQAMSHGGRANVDQQEEAEKELTERDDARPQIIHGDDIDDQTGQTTNMHRFVAVSPLRMQMKGTVGDLLRTRVHSAACNLRAAPPGGSRDGRLCAEPKLPRLL
jgi:hypothetical protein